MKKTPKELLTDFHNIIFDDTQIQSEVSSDQIIDFSVEVEMNECVAGSSSQSIPEEFERVENELTNMDQQPIVYVSGYIASSILKNFLQNKTKYKYQKGVPSLENSAESGYENDFS